MENEKQTINEAEAAASPETVEAPKTAEAPKAPAPRRRSKKQRRRAARIGLAVTLSVLLILVIGAAIAAVVMGHRIQHSDKTLPNVMIGDVAVGDTLSVDIEICLFSGHLVKNNKRTLSQLEDILDRLSGSSNLNGDFHGNLHQHLAVIVYFLAAIRYIGVLWRFQRTNGIILFCCSCLIHLHSFKSLGSSFSIGFSFLLHFHEHLHHLELGLLHRREQLSHDRICSHRLCVLNFYHNWR